MPEQFQRPENAHKRALEFLDVNKPRAAQEVLLDLIKSKRHRSWSKEHEAIMDTLVKLNVELKDSKAAKESLFQYRLTCHSVNIKSLEDVIRKHIALSEQRVEKARKKVSNSPSSEERLLVLEKSVKMLFLNRLKIWSHLTDHQKI